ncbi:WD repeat-containing protein 76 [Ophiophagus hannah]|uniref:WD repeat-containing protein 76 n=1 Tax=Ophiophagus hannah TaxID=8665 RepID=V8P4F8_OPHHA|nr:WD repeat-containing protein 76 [Ophiophagus hannah]
MNVFLKHNILEVRLYCLGRVKSPKAETKTTCRRSMRLQRIDPLGIPLQESEAKVESPVEEEHARLPPGPHPMVATVQEPETDTFLSMWAKISQVEGKKSEKSSCNLESYKARLHGMVLREEHVAKVVTSRIYSVAVHPSESRTLVAAGDKWGQIGLWDLDSSLENGAYVFIPHSQAVSCLHFSPINPAHLLSLSHDGTLRSGDVTRRVFEEIYRNESHSLSSFDFLASDASTLVVGMWDGNVAIVDRRTPIPSPEISVDLHSKTRTVHVHPVSRQYFVAAGERLPLRIRHRHHHHQVPLSISPLLPGYRTFLPSSTSEHPALWLYPKALGPAGSAITYTNVCSTRLGVVMQHARNSTDLINVSIYDARHLKSRSQPVVALNGHSKSVASAYFSPVTGNRIVTTCADDTLRHNNNTGRWLTRFQAVWDPKRDDCFVVGSMTRPRQIQAFHTSGELLYSFLNEDYLNSVCSINSWHPTRFLVAGGNSSGRLHVFKE